jgi:hypothetical protein
VIASARYDRLEVYAAEGRKTVLAVQYEICIRTTRHLSGIDV